MSDATTPETNASSHDDELWLVTHRALRSVPRVDALWRFLDERFTSAAVRAR